MTRHSLSVIDSAPPRIPDRPEYFGDVAAFGDRVVQAGQRAIVAATQGDLLKEQGDELGAGVASLRRETEIDNARAGLAEVRTQLRGLEADQKHRLERYIAQHLGGLRSEHLGHRMLTDWLADPNRGASDDELYGFLESHVHHIANQQRRPEYLGLIDEGQREVTAGVHRAVEQGWFSPHALQAVKRLDKIPVYIGDLWDATVMKGAYGYVPELGGDYIVLAQAYKGDIRSSDQVAWELRTAANETLPHEDDHIIFGHGKALWFAEALAEHDAQSLRDGKFYAMHPSDRGESDSHIYMMERALVATLCEAGMAQVSVGMVTRAHTSANLESPEWTALMEAWDKAWGTTDTYGKVTRRVEKLTAEYLAASPNASLGIARANACRQVVADLHQKFPRA